MLIRLGEEDRKRLECPEWLSWDAGQFMIDEAIALEEQSGMGPDDYRALVAGKPIFEDGQPVIRPDGRQARKQSPKVLKVVVWMALRRADIHVPWADLTFNLLQYETRTDESDSDDDAEDKTPGPD